MYQPHAIIGAGGHGREVAQVAIAAIRGGAPMALAGFFDDAPDLQLLRRLGLDWLGPVAAAADFDGGVWLGLGSGELKRRLSTGLDAAPALKHPMADVGTDVELSEGAVVFAQTTVTTNVVVGAHAHVGRGAAVGHDSTVGAFASIMPLASVGGNVSLGEGCFVGTGAALRQGVSIGAGATVGMGAVVLKDVPAGATVIGNPARPLGG